MAKRVSRHLWFALLTKPEVLESLDPEPLLLTVVKEVMLLGNAVRCRIAQFVFIVLAILHLYFLFQLFHAGSLFKTALFSKRL